MRWAAGFLRRLPAAVFAGVLLVGGTTAAAFGQAGDNLVSVARPAPGQTVAIQAAPGRIYVLDFTPGTAQALVQGDHLALAFDDNGDGTPDSWVILLGMVTVAASGDPPVIRTAGVDIGTDTFVRQLQEQMRPDENLWENAAGASPGDPLDPGSGGPLSVEGLRITGRDLLLKGRKERRGHPLYSYLLYSGAREGTREERLRFHAAIQAYVGQFSPVEVLENSGSERREINVFYVPVTKVRPYIQPPGPSAYFFNLSAEEQAALLQENYDYGQAEDLMRSMLLSGNGPYIVSVLRPLSAFPVDESEAFLVQDLSGVPAELVGLWVDEFKRQVVREAIGSPEHLRRLALDLRTRIAVMAEAFSITRSAVAEMFEAPEKSGTPTAGGGN